MAICVASVCVAPYFGLGQNARWFIRFMDKRVHSANGMVLRKDNQSIQLCLSVQARLVSLVYLSKPRFR